MQRYVARANIDHYIGLLNGGDLPPHNRDTILKLLIAEEDSLGHDLEHLEFAESRAASGRQRLNHLVRLRGAFAPGTTERAQADRTVVNFERLQALLDDFCHRLRDRINARGL
ncbi:MULTISPECIES: hypothetical protein [Bradyrhizobium]|uniref:hypothetical protein n=1 Tax=Bradyrhizobium TaxID=374 RepID=UPI001BA9D76A|nr:MULTISPECIES: hypothetical protein [Bradyrhizobium]MBR0709841.1 hypothetical protein [Bradyrhizobium liaoningense]MDA9402726.1 hypothetical protein [Bradyrhizobium sp. CCBAU 45389]